VSQQINLFNPIFLKQKKYFSAATMAQALGLIGGGTVLVAAYAGYQTLQLQGQVKESLAQMQLAQAQYAQTLANSPPRQKSRDIEEKIRAAEGEARTMQQAFETLQRGELGHRNGYSEYFRAFGRQIVPDLWLTSVQIVGAGNDIQLSGRTLRPDAVPEFLHRLRREAILRGKSFSTLEMRRPEQQDAGGTTPGNTAAQSQPAPGVIPGAPPATTRPERPRMPGYIEFRLAGSVDSAAGGGDATGRK